MLSFTFLTILYLTSTSAPDCEIWASQRTNDEWPLRLSELVSQRAGASCGVQGAAVADPFAFLAGLGERELPRLFVFWIDVNPQSQEVLLRGLDTQSRLQWSARRGESRDPLSRNVEALFSEHPFLGVLMKDRTLIWGSRVTSRVTILRRTQTEPHPFLPSVLSMKGNPIRGGLPLGPSLHALENLDFETHPFFWIRREALE